MTERMKRMLGRVPDDLDKRQGSLVWNALGPADVEFSKLDMTVEEIYYEMFGDTASRTYLERRAREAGVIPYPPEKAEIKAFFDAPVPIGTKFRYEDLVYTVTESLGDGYYALVCDTEGAAGNLSGGDLLPVDYIAGLETARVEGLVKPGRDVEDTEKFRARYLESLLADPYGGNIADYKMKVMGLEGVGAVKVTPVWKGGGTVRIDILNADFRSPSSELVAKVQEALDPVPVSGKGVGIAPIGHRVTVFGATETKVNISTKITFAAGVGLSDIRSAILMAIDEYLGELAREWTRSDRDMAHPEKNVLTVRLSQVDTRILDLPGVVDIQETMINGERKNLVLDRLAIPVRGDFDARS